MDLQASRPGDRLSGLSKSDIPTSLEHDENLNCPIMTVPVSENIDSFGESLKERCVIIKKDDKGYGLTVSGDNPVFVQSVKEDGAATRAGVQEGDRIIKVNGTLVTQCNHLEVVKLIRSGSYVALTLLGHPPGNYPKPSVSCGTIQSCSTSSSLLNTQPSHSMTSIASNQKPSSPSERITAPQPVDAEKQQELTNRRIHTIKMMLEQELGYLDKLRSDFAKNASDKIRADLNGATKRVKTLQDQLLRLTGVHHHEQTPVPFCPRSPPSARAASAEREARSPMCEREARISLPEKDAPPLFHPHVFQHQHSDNCSTVSSSKGNILTHQISAPLPVKSFDIPNEDVSTNSQTATIKDNADHTPHVSKSPKAKKWRPQSSHRHQRHISSPEGLSQFTEQLQVNRDGISRTQSELVSRRDRIQDHDIDFKKIPERPMRLPSVIKDDQSTPPGTPPPPYAVTAVPPLHLNIDLNGFNDMTDAAPSDLFHLLPPSFTDEPPPPPPRMSPCAIAANFEGRPLPPIPSQQINSSQPIADSVPPALPARPPPGQVSSIMSMEEEESPSDSEVGQLDDHGPFMSLWKLLRNPPHLAVFLYYLICNSDPSSLFFYFISEMYKEGKLSDMKKWAYEIHSTFLVPDAPLRVNNIDETILYEIDYYLQHNLEKEEDLRNIFTKPRRKACEELNKLLEQFRNKRTLGLGSIFGPPDLVLQEANNDKGKEIKIIEHHLLPRLQTMCEDLENLDDKNHAMASALATILKQLGVKSQQAFNLIDRCPTFVAKDKSRIRFLKGNKKLMFVREHNFIPQHYCVVTYCNHCQLIIWGVGNQGYQCQNCEMNVHKNCVKILDEVCIGSIRPKKDKKKEDRKKDRMSGLMENIIGKNKKPSTAGTCDRSKKLNDDSDTTSPTEDQRFNENGEKIVSASASGRVKVRQESVQEGSEITRHLSKKGTGPTGRSESFRQRRENRPSFRKRSDPNIPRSKSDVDVDDKAVLNGSQSSSNSSLSTSLESPSNSLEAVHRNASGPMTAAKVDEIASSLPVGSSSHVQNSVSSPQNIHVQHHVYDDSDLEAENEAPNWQEGIEWSVVHKLKPKEKNRQDVINELFHTEKTHVRNLKVLESVFFRPMIQEQVASHELIGLLFGNLEEMIEIHGSINSAMKEKKQENAIVGDIGDLMLNMFDGVAGENLKQAAAKFCQNQSIALDMLRHRQRKDQKLSQFISEAEMNHLCRRLQLKDIIPTGMQRLTKYPLLLENIAKYSIGGTEEHKKVLRAVDCTKKILNHVNQSVKEAENKQRLLELQKKIDRSHFDKVDHPISHEFKNLDLAKYKLIHDGSLTWRLTKQKTIDVYLLVLDQFFILLHKQDEKYVLKFHNTNILSGRDDTKLLRSPIIKLENVLTRDNATDKRSFFLVMTSRAEHQPAIYELVARSVSEKKTWVKNIQDTCDNFKSRALISQPIPALSERSESNEEPADIEVVGKAKEPIEQESSPVAGDAGHASDNGDHIDPGDSSDKQTPSSQAIEPATPSTPPSGTNDNGNKAAEDASSIMDDQPNKSITNTLTPPTPPASNSSTPSPARRMQRVEILQIAEGPRLIEPSEVVVTQGAVIQTAQPVLTPIEKLRRKDEQIVTALQDKQQIVAEILSVPPEEFENIADVVTEVKGEKEPKELVLAAIVQVNRLASILNETLRVTEEDTVSASVAGGDEFVSAGASGSCPPPRSPKSPRLVSKISRMPAAPTHKLMAVSKTLNQQLTELLNVIVQRDEEREQFRKELRSSREQIHLLHEATRRRNNSSQVTHSRPDSFTSIESSISGEICNENNALSDHCSCDNPPSEDESGANISPLQGVVPEIGIAESVQANFTDSAMPHPCPPDSSKCESAEEQEHVEIAREMFVDAPSETDAIPPPPAVEEDLPITNLDSDNEIEINVDGPDCDEEGMIVDSADHAPMDLQNNEMTTDNEKTENNNDNVPPQNSMIGAIFF